MIKLTLITIAHFSIAKHCANFFKNYMVINTRNRSNNNFFTPRVNTHIGKKSIQYRGGETGLPLKLCLKLLGPTTF